MIAILPIVFILLCTIIYSKSGSIVRSIATSTVIFTAIAYVMTEALSVFQILNNTAVTVFWMLTAVGMLLVLMNQRDALQSVVAVTKRKYHQTDLAMKCMVLAFGVWFVYLIYLAYSTIPNNWDSMTYHLPRVMHWIQNESVAYYATNIDRQVVSPVLSEYLILHTYLLSGTEHYVNLVQNLACIVMSVVVYGIAREFGAGKYTSFIAPFVFLMVPMVIAQSFSTQTDLLAALYLVLCSYYLIEFLKCQKLVWNKSTMLECGMMAACVAFAYLTKQTVCLVILLLLIVLVIVRLWKKDKASVLIYFTVLSAMVMIGLALPGFIRSYETYGSLMADEGSHTVTLDDYNPQFVLVNTYKNAVCNYVVEYIPHMDQLLTRLGYSLAYHLGVNLDDPAIASMAFCVISGSYHHDQAVSFGINYMMLAVMILFLVYWGKYKKNSPLLLFTMVNVASFFILCMMIRWSPWMLRYMVGIYALYAAIIAATIAPLVKKTIGKLFLVAVIALSLLEGLQAYDYNAQIANYSNITEDPNDLYFFVRGEQEGYAKLCDYILAADVDEIGLILGIDTYEYPLWTGLSENLPTMKHIQVQSEALAVYEDPTYVPDLIIDINVHNYQLGEELFYNGHTYVCDYIGEFVGDVGYVLKLVA